MLRKLKFKCTLHHDHKTFDFDREIDFEKGLTSITGPNESGKSFIMEMIRFALFGADALRGAVSSYKGLTNRLEFKVKDRELVVERTTSKAKLMEGDEVLAVGTKPVNAKIVEIFGYDIDVFDTANATLQGKVEAMGDMRPADRKKMVDQTVGINFLDQLTNWTSEQIKTTKATVEALERVPAPGQAPEKPVDYLPSDDLRKTRTECEELDREAAELSGWLSRPMVEPVAPVQPEKPTDYEPSDTLRARRKELDVFVQEAAKLKGMLSHKLVEPVEPRKPDIGSTLEELRRQQAAIDVMIAEKQALEKQVAGLPVLDDSVTAEGLDAIAAHWTMWRAWQGKKKLLDMGSFTCPHCNATSPLQHDQLKHFDAVIEVARPEVDEARLGLYRQALAARETRAKLKEIQIPMSRHESIKALEKYAADKAAYETAAASYDRAQELNQVAAKRLAEIDAMKIDMSALNAQLDRCVGYESAVQRFAMAVVEFDKRREAYENYLFTAAQKQSRLDDLSAMQIDMPAINAQLDRAVRYETGLQAHAEAMARYETVSDELKASKALLEDWTASREAVKETKDKVKAYLVPSLGKAASAMMNRMTGGDRKVIEVDEDFDIKVDGVPIGVLSGSGKAVANLALRLALGQVLTHKVFGVVMLDEVDAAMDADRVGYTAECLKNLAGELDQVILISHKRPPADHYIELEAA